MAREKKPIELRPVAEAPVDEADVVLLRTDPKSLRVLPERGDPRPRAEARLEVGDDARRSHEPGVETLLAAELASMGGEEPRWIEEVAVVHAPIPWGWFVLLGLLLAGAVGWSLNYVIRADSQVKGLQLQVAQTVIGAEALDREIERSIERMEQTVRKFCEARTLDELMPLVRHPARVGPLMKAYYEETPLQPIGFRRIKDFQGAPLGTLNSFWAYKVVAGNGRTRVLMVEEENGEFRVDWETAMTYQPMKWDRYAAERPAGTTLDFRVNVEEDNFFSHEFADAERWRSFRLTTPGCEETLFGYAARGSVAETMLVELLKANPGKPAPVVLRLGLPVGLLSRRGVIIEKVMSTRWIYVTPPDSDG